jgi:hypothetical protein
MAYYLEPDRSFSEVIAIWNISTLAEKQNRATIDLSILMLHMLLRWRNNSYFDPFAGYLFPIRL